MLFTSTTQAKENENSLISNLNNLLDSIFNTKEMCFKHSYIYNHKAKLYAKLPWPEQIIRKLIPRIVNTVLEATNEYIQKIHNTFISFGSSDLPLCHVLVRKAGSSSDWWQFLISEFLMWQLDRWARDAHQCKLLKYKYWGTNPCKLWTSHSSLAKQTPMVVLKEQRCPVRLDLTTASTISCTCFPPFFQYYLSHVPVGSSQLVFFPHTRPQIVLLHQVFPAGCHTWQPHSPCFITNPSLAMMYTSKDNCTTSWHI